MSESPAALGVDEEAAGLDRSSLPYTSCYCEENAYFVAERLEGLLAEGGRRVFVVFLSTADRRLPLFFQRAGGPAGSPGLVVWDYHVIAMTVGGGAPGAVWDLDSTLPFPCPAADYARLALRDPGPGRHWGRRFRVVDARGYLDGLGSDRSHMVGDDGAWLAEPPGYAPLVAADGERSNLARYVDVGGEAARPEDLGALLASLREAGRFGVVLDEGDFVRLLCR